MNAIDIISREDKKVVLDNFSPDMSVILVCWNNLDYLEPCLDSLYDCDLNYKFDVVVVDNGSTDGSQDMLREKFSQVKIIQNEYNLGLGRASNQGIEATSGRYILLLNNDTIVNGPSLNNMVDFLDAHHDAGAVGGRMLNPDGSFQAADAKFPTLREEFLISTRLGALIWPNYPDLSSPERIKSVDWLGSACLLLRRDALSDVGLLDEDYFIYGDEADLQYRLKKAGWGVYFIPNATTIHYGGRSMDRWHRRKMVYRGKLLFFKNNYRTIQLWLLQIMYSVMSLGKIVAWSLVLINPKWRDRANKEFSSNLEVLKICWNLQ